ncbi:hybrid sensor histidine kinase/response regulator transcription factor [Flavivirga jejuensis]|uniref:histidine kinase n=1 Tax=Flavivirga jejuensis TaxID=870487 RepID=A0ABT8WMB0_9FLAO|nr:two-component regulator propeller domain-containing protein [Flavivirga jejuensis]MDO5974283.1 two-component regulator propeller domain-containing protein [Flavivirga jejuensis]
MNFWFSYILISLVTSVVFSTNNPDPYISLSKITPDGGVAYSQVTSIVEDNQGLIWFSTNNGLFSYNTVKIKRYSHLQNDSTTVSTNRINTLYKDNQGNMWVATENGLCSYNLKHDNFKRWHIRDQFDNYIGKNITSFFQDDDGAYWFSDEKGIGVINFKTNRAFYKNINSKTNSVYYLNIDENQSIWAFYNDGGIYYLPKGSNTFQYFTKGLKNRIRSVLVENDFIWIGYESRGLYCISTIDGTVINHFEANNSASSIPNNQVRSLLKDSNNRIWVGTYEGIAIIEDFEVKLIIDQQKYSSLPNHSIWSLYQDSHKNVWIGTWMGGLAFHNDCNNSFLHYNQSTSKKSISDNVISSFIETPDKQHILIGIDDGDLNVFNPKTNTFTTKPIIYNRDTIQNIKALAYDKNETLWVGTYGNGVLYQRKNEQTFKRLIPPFTSGFQALDILTTNDGIWVSDYPLGVYFYHFDSKTFTKYLHNPLNINSLSNNNVRHIIEDEKGNIWFATENGLNLLKKDASKFIHFFNQENNPQSISANYIYCLHEDSKGFLWLGTNGQGLDKFDPKTGIAAHFTVKERLPRNEIFSILEDNNHNLWLTTENGLCKFNSQSNTMQSYVSNKGIKNNRFHPIAALRSLNGELYFGGSNGLIRFLPNKINTNPTSPKPTITRIYVNNIEVFPEVNTSSLERFLKLNHTQNSISLQFISNNYINPQNNKFKYRLVGFDNDWIYTDFNGKAHFTNIPPNNYTFEVKAANNDGVWNENPTKISINIIPPIWKRWYAYLLYISLFIYSIYFYRKQVINRQKLKSEISLGKIQRENEEQMYQMKLQFFTNISHEFRTPLTLIQGPVNRLLKTDANNESSNKQLTLIKNNTDRLLRLVNQFLDFRRANSGTLKLNPINTDIVSFCKNIFKSFEEHANHRGFDFSFKSSIPNLKMDFDTDKLDKVLVNILSNAFKNTSNNGAVTLKIQSNTKSIYNSKWSQHTIGENISRDFIEISISDTGNGIPTDKLPLIFERFFQVENNYNKGTGIGLSLSTNYISLHHGQLTVSTKETKGTTIYIYIPQYHAESLRDNSDKSKHLNTSDFTSEASSAMDAKIKNEESDENQDSLILIAEDHPELLDFLGDSLQNHFRIARAKDGKDAYEQVHSLYPDLVVSDIMMPEINGIELCEKIKNDVRTSHIPFILLTALDSIQDKIAGMHSGADAYLDKPFDNDLLIAQINNLLDSRKTLRESFSGIQEGFEDSLEIHDLDKKLLIKAVYIIDKNLSNSEFTVEDLAANLNLSRTHLHRKLKSITNQSATEFIRSIRLKHAIKLMKEGKYIVKEIGYAVGFSSHNYFTKTFKKQYGKSPSEFIKENFENLQTTSLKNE